MKNSRLLLATVIAGSLFAHSAYAQTVSAKPAEAAAAQKPGALNVSPGATLNANSVLFTRKEAIARATTQFDEVDANKDGSITKGEMDAFRDKKRAEMEQRQKEMNSKAPAAAIAAPAKKP